MSSTMRGCAPKKIWDELAGNAFIKSFANWNFYLQYKPWYVCINVLYSMIVVHKHKHINDFVIDESLN